VELALGTQTPTLNTLILAASSEPSRDILINNTYFHCHSLQSFFLSLESSLLSRQARTRALRQYLLSWLKNVPTVAFNSRHEADSVLAADGLSNRRTESGPECVCARVRVRAGARVLYTYVTKNVSGNVNRKENTYVNVCVGAKSYPATTTNQDCATSMSVLARAKCSTCERKV
jgi:hypothetical protein